MITGLVPNSIKSNETTSYDKTWEDRLKKLNIEQLLVNIETENDPVKLEYWMQMFGIDTSVFDLTGLSEAQRRALIKSWLDIVVNSGSEYSVKKMALALGATQCDIIYGDTLYYNGMARHNGMYYRDGGSSYSRFSITVVIYGIAIADRADYNSKFRKLMRAAQPVRIYLKAVNFV